MHLNRGLAVLVINQDGSGLRTVGHSACCLDTPPDTRPAWSPDSKHIACSVCRFGFLQGEEQKGFGHESCGIEIMASDGSSRSILTRHPLDGDSDLAVSWAPRESLTLHRASLTGSGIYSIEADGTRLTRIRSSDASLPTWSPDGKTMAFEVFRRVGDCELFVAGERTKPKKVADAFARDAAIAWSPDGTKLTFAYSRQPDRIDVEDETDIFTIELSEDAASEPSPPKPLTSGPDVDSNPSWRPDKP